MPYHIAIPWSSKSISGSNICKSASINVHKVTLVELWDSVLNICWPFRLRLVTFLLDQYDFTIINLLFAVFWYHKARSSQALKGAPEHFDVQNVQSCMILKSRSWYWFDGLTPWVDVYAVLSMRVYFAQSCDNEICINIFMLLYRC